MENAIQSFHSILQGSAWHSATGLVQYSLPGHQVTTISSFEKLFLKFYFQYNKQNVVMVKKNKSEPGMPDGEIPRFLDLHIHPLKSQLKELKRWPKRRQTHLWDCVSV